MTLPSSNRSRQTERFDWIDDRGDRLANLNMGNALLNETLRDAAQTKGRGRCECFVKALGRRVEKSQILTKEVSTEIHAFASGK